MRKVLLTYIIFLFFLTGCSSRSTTVESAKNDFIEINPLNDYPMIFVQNDWSYDVTNKDILYERSMIVVKGYFTEKKNSFIADNTLEIYTTYLFQIQEVYKGERTIDEDIRVFLPGGQVDRDYVDSMKVYSDRPIEDKDLLVETPVISKENKNDVITENYGINPAIIKDKRALENRENQYLLYLFYVPEFEGYSLMGSDSGFKQIVEDEVISLNLTDEKTNRYSSNDIIPE